MSGQKYPEPTVGALIFNRSGELFLMKSHKWRGKYVVPGGHLELGETIEQAVVREVKEETNLDVYDLEFLCLQEFIYDQVFWKPNHFLFLDYTCRTDQTVATLNHEAQEYLWASLDEALRLPVDGYTAHAINEVIRRRNQTEE